MAHEIESIAPGQAIDGMCVLAFGVLLLIIKLTMIIAWYGGVVAIAGLILLAGGWILRRV